MENGKCVHRINCIKLRSFFPKK